jgi:hypothetical protein
LQEKRVAKKRKRHNLPKLTPQMSIMSPYERRQIMAHVQIQCHDNRVVIKSQAFWCEFWDTWANRKVLFVVLRALRSPETGKPLVTYQELAEGFGYADRRNLHNFLQEFQACAADFEQYLRRKRKVDAAVVAAVTEEVRQAPLVSEAVLCERVAGH